MADIKIVYQDPENLREYQNNPRYNDDAVKAVAESIKEFGFKNPIIVDKNNVIVCGHTRLKAAKMLALDRVPTISADDLTDEQIRAFRLADNKTNELSEWNIDLLNAELDSIFDIDMTDFGFEGGDISEAAAEELDNTYSSRVEVPHYEITGDCPDISELVDKEKTEKLIEEIKTSSVTEEEKAFLIDAAGRHNVFNYRNCAEYYAHATPEMQRLMEKSALVIIDINNAIANGYVTLSESIREIMEESNA